MPIATIRETSMTGSSSLGTVSFSEERLPIGVVNNNKLCQCQH